MQQAQPHEPLGLKSQRFAEFQGVKVSVPGKDAALTPDDRPLRAAICAACVIDTVGTRWPSRSRSVMPHTRTCRNWARPASNCVAQRAFVLGDLAEGRGAATRGASSSAAQIAGPARPDTRSRPTRRRCTRGFACRSSSDRAACRRPAAPCRASSVSSSSVLPHRMPTCGPKNL